MVPIMKAEVVERQEWIGLDDFMNVLAIGNALPGPIVTKMSAAVGYHKAGWPGAIAALFGVIMPSAAALLALMGFVYLVKGNPLVSSALKGLRPVVVAMLAYAAWDMTPNAIKAKEPATVLIAVIALIIMVVSRHFPHYFSIHPALIIVVGAGVGVMLKL